MICFQRKHRKLKNQFENQSVLSSIETESKITEVVKLVMKLGKEEVGSEDFNRLWILCKDDSYF